MTDRDRRLAKRRKAVSGDVVPSVRMPKPEVDEGPSPEDIERFGDVTQRCPACGTELYDDVAVCWNCGEALGAEKKGGMSVAQRWAVGVVVLIIIAFLITVVL